MLSPELSATCTVKVEVPLVVGVPLRIPVAGSSVRPGGGAVTDQR